MALAIVSPISKAAEEILPLGFATSTFRFAARPGTATSVAELAGLRVAAAYPALVQAHLAEHGVSAQVIRLDGAVETAVRLGVADVNHAFAQNECP